MVPRPADFERWLNRQPGFGDARVASITPVDGGASNITCRVELLSGREPRVCLRLQRERGIFEPYDVVREGRVIAALAATDVPVPAVIAIEADPGPLGAPFIVLEWVDAPHMGMAPDADFDAFTRMVARIHAVDWRGAGLEFLGVPGSVREALAGELDAVERRMFAFGCAGEPMLRDALERLRAALPGEGRIGLCQGDINVFNYLFRGGEVVAVVDWEQAKLSDPRMDLGQLLALSHLKGAPFGPAERMPFAVRYAAAAGKEPGDLRWFRAAWLWQLGVIHYGWRRYGNGSEPWYGLGQLGELLQMALAELG
ncbi:MAG: acyl-CoA dehydrogenase [Tepidiforma sp.]|nr:MAG: acyl-CoA dehydrogenase [Tepidiforma sp.]